MPPITFGPITNIGYFQAHLRHVGELLHTADREIVQADHVVALGHEPVTDRRADEPRGAGDQDPHAHQISPCALR